MLAEAGVDPAAINGYAHGEYTHAAVAAYVASGMADVSFGVEAAIRQFCLDFVRLLIEDYFFVCRRETLELEAVKAMLEIMRGDVFRRKISAVPGYSGRDPGSIRTIGQVFQRSTDVPAALSRLSSPPGFADPDRRSAGDRPPTVPPVPTEQKILRKLTRAERSGRVFPVARMGRDKELRISLRRALHFNEFSERANPVG